MANREKDLDDILKELDDMEDMDVDPFDDSTVEMTACRHCGSISWDSGNFIKGRLVRCSDCPKWHETN